MDDIIQGGMRCVALISEEEVYCVGSVCQLGTLHSTEGRGNVVHNGCLGSNWNSPMQLLASDLKLFSDYCHILLQKIP